MHTTVFHMLDGTDVSDTKKNLYRIALMGVEGKEFSKMFVKGLGKGVRIAGLSRARSEALRKKFEPIQVRDDEKK